MERTPYRDSLARLRKSISAYEAGDEEALKQGLADFFGSLPTEDSDRRVRASGISCISGEEYPLPAPRLDGKELLSRALEEGRDMRSVACPSYWAFSREMDFPNGLSIRRRSKEELIEHPYGKVVFFRWGRNMYAFHTLNEFEGDLKRTHERKWHTHIERAVGRDIEDIKPEPKKPRPPSNIFPGRTKGVTIVYNGPLNTEPAAEPAIWKGRPVPQRLSIRSSRRESAIDIDYRAFRRGTKGSSITAWRLEAYASGDYEAPLVGMMIGYAGQKATTASPEELSGALAAMPLDLLRGLPRRLESFEDFLTG